MFNLSNLYHKILNSEVGNRMASGALWSLSGTAIGKCIVLVAGILCARILGTEQYGEFGMVRSTINMFITFGVAGMGLTATKYISEFRQNQPERIPSIYLLTNSISIGLGIVISAIIIILAPLITDLSLKSPNLTEDLRWGGILLFFTILNGVQNGTLCGFEDFKSIAINTFIGCIAESVFMCIGAYYYGVTGAIIGFGSGFIVIYALNKFSIKKRMRDIGINISLKQFRRNDLSIIYKFSFPSALQSLLIAPTYWFVKSMIIQYDGYSQLGIYEAADQWRIIILFIPTAVSQIVLPILSSIVNIDTSKFWRILKLNILLNTSIAGIIGLLICSFAKPLMSLYGDGFGNHWVLISLALSTIFSACANVIGLSISSRAKMWAACGFNALWALLLIIFTHLYLKILPGALALSVALLSAYCAHCTVQLIYIKRITK